MKVNSPLSKCIDEMGIKLSDLDDYVLIDRFKILLAQGFRTSDITGCVYFGGYGSEESSELIKQLHDFTGLECFINDVSIDESVNNRKKMLIQGMLFASKLAKLLVDYSEARFKVILTYDGDSCTVRFHQIRQGENWVDNDLDSYQDGLAVMEE